MSAQAQLKTPFFSLVKSVDLWSIGLSILGAQSFWTPLE